MTTLECSSEPENPPDDVERPLFEAAPARIGRVVAQNRRALALRFEGNPLDAQHVIHPQDIDPVSQARLAIGKIDHDLVAIVEGGLHRVAMHGDDR